MLLKLLFWALLSLSFNEVQKPDAIKYEPIQTEEACTLPAPSGGSGTNHGTYVDCSWNAVSGATGGYYVILKRMDTGAVVDETEVYTEYYYKSGTSSTVDYKAYIAPICGNAEVSESIIIIDMLGV